MKKIIINNLIYQDLMRNILRKIPFARPLKNLLLRLVLHHITTQTLFYFYKLDVTKKYIWLIFQINLPSVYFLNYWSFYKNHQMTEYLEVSP